MLVLTGAELRAQVPSPTMPSPRRLPRYGMTNGVPARRRVISPQRPRQIRRRVPAVAPRSAGSRAVPAAPVIRAVRVVRAVPGARRLSSTYSASSLFAAQPGRNDCSRDRLILKAWS